MCWGPKDGELCLRRAKSGETYGGTGPIAMQGWAAGSQRWEEQVSVWNLRRNFQWRSGFNLYPGMSHFVIGKIISLCKPKHGYPVQLCSTNERTLKDGALIAVAKIVGLRAAPCQMLLSNPKHEVQNLFTCVEGVLESTKDICKPIDILYM